MEAAGENLTLSIGPPSAKRIWVDVENRESAIDLDLSLSPPGDHRSEINLNLNLSLNGQYGPRERINAAARGKAPMVYPAEEEAPQIRMGSDAAEKGKAPMLYGGTPQPQGIGAIRGANLNRGRRLAYLDGEQRLANLNGGQRLLTNTGQRLLTNTVLNMPYVTASTLILNYGQVEGILYQYRMSEEPKIVCVCHGMFMSPGEFIKHGGGGDVDDPLKYISVSPRPSNILRG